MKSLSKQCNALGSNIRRYLATVIRLLPGLLLTGCASLMPQPSDSLTNQTSNQRWQQHQVQLAALDNWRIHGRFSAQKDNEAWHGSLRWQQRGDRYEIQLSGPFGQGAVQLQGDQDISKLRLSPQEHYSANNPETLLENYTGFSLPIKHLTHWIRGMPAPLVSTDAFTTNEAGYLVTLNQAGWSVLIKGYIDVESNAQSMHLPRKLFLENQIFDVRLVIDQWQLTV